jgi:hypothetical protein
MTMLISLSLTLPMTSCLAILLMADLIVFNLETNTIVESCDVIFDVTASCPHDVFECVGDKKIEKSTFVDE